MRQTIFLIIVFCLLFSGFAIGEAGLDSATHEQPLNKPAINPPAALNTGRSVEDFLMPDGRFDLEAARRSGYQGSVNNLIPVRPEPADVISQQSQSKEQSGTQLLPFLVGYWRFDEGSGSIATDSSGNGNNGNLFGNPTWTTGISGGALEFDGIDDYVQIPHSESLNISGSQVTFMAWVYSTGFQNYGWIVAKGNNGGDLVWWVLPRENGNFLRYGIVTDGWTELDIPVGLQNNKWQHIAVVYDGSFMRLYVDGVERHSAVKTGNLRQSISPVYIGLDGWSPTNHYRGKIDEVKVYRHALSEGELLQEFRRCRCGDANGDAAVNVSDAVYIINYVFVGGNPPNPLASGDANCDGASNVSDAVWIINYVFAGGQTPCANCP